VLVSVVVACAFLCEPRPALAEVREVRIAQQFGVAYLPLMVMRHEKLIERQAEKIGIGPLKVTWTTFGSGADMNVALISRTLDFASGGIAPVLQVWDRTEAILLSRASRHWARCRFTSTRSTPKSGTSRTSRAQTG
jgi:ABC-type nitrate/sulfonate/bicarbonate transport system substrate-binding protein